MPLSLCNQPHDILLGLLGICASFRLLEFAFVYASGLGLSSGSSLGLGSGLGGGLGDGFGLNSFDLCNNLCVNFSVSF